MIRNDPRTMIRAMIRGYIIEVVGRIDNIVYYLGDEAAR